MRFCWLEDVIVMALNLPSPADAGHRQPIIKYDARAGRLFRVDRSDETGRWESNPVEITSVFQAIFDLENIETGWLHFPTGGAPDIRTVKIGSALPDRPTDKHRTGFRVLMLLGKQSGGDVREMAANAAVAIKGMDLLHDAFMAAPERGQGMLPVVRLGSTIPVTTTGKAQGQPVSSTNYQPVWQVVKWVPRPVELQPGYDQKEAAPPQVQQASPPAPQPAPAPPPPAPEPQRQLASVDDDF
jgi:hypothetical protein